MSQDNRHKKLGFFFRMRCFWLIVGLFAIHTSMAAAEDKRVEPWLRWTESGMILANEQWLIDPHSEEITLIAGCVGKVTCAFSASGNRYVLFERYGAVHDSMDWEGSGFRYARTGGPLSERQPVPEWVEIPDDSEEPDKAALFTDTYFFWVDDDTLFVDQRNDRVGGQECHLFDTDEQRWRPKQVDCLSTKGFSLVSVVPGPNGLLAVYSSSEGSPSADLYQWRAGEGLVNLNFPFAGHYIYGAWINFTDRPDRIEIATRCTFQPTDRDRAACDDVTEETPIRHYLWNWNEPETFEIVAESSKTKTLADPTDPRRVALPVPGGVCIRDREAEQRCIELPVR